MCGARASVDDGLTLTDACATRLRAIADDVQARGKEFTLLARLSPVPSWANNYGLALAGVEPAAHGVVREHQVHLNRARVGSCRRSQSTRALFK